MKKNRDLAGMSILEVIIASSIGIVLVLGMTSMMQMIQKLQQSVTSSADFTSLSTHLSLITLSDQLCKKSLALNPSGASRNQGFNPNNDQKQPIVFYLPETNTPLAAEDMTIGNWKIDELKLQKQTASDPGMILGANKLFLVNLSLSATKTATAQTVGSPLRSETFPMGIILNSSNRIVGCYGRDSGAAQACQSLGGTHDGTNCLFSGQPLTQAVAKSTCNSITGASWNATSSKCTIAVAAAPTATAPTSAPTATSTPTTTPTAAPTACPGGAQPVGSPDGSNSCYFTWSASSIGASPNITGTNGGTAYGTCQSSGVLSATYVCPNKSGATCVGGLSVSFLSLSGKTKCTFTFPQATEGEVVTVNGTNSGVATGTCKKDGWNYSVVCNDPGTKSCSQGTEIANSATKPGVTCIFNFNSVPAPTSGVSVTGSNGGTAKGDCDNNGFWQNVVITCP